MTVPHVSISGAPKAIRRGHIRLGGGSPSGERIDVTNYYIERNGEPWFAIAGEFHYSRFRPSGWMDALAKMKLGGLDVVFTYVFWNHHEEVMGEFDWTGRRDLRRFIGFCAEAGLRVIARIGPFCHGEVRNGGLPDWLYGRPFPVRSNAEGYLAFVRRWYDQIGAQLKGLLFKDGGPVIGVQIENEYGHAGAPWEQTVGVNNEWMEAGRDGESHMLTLKAMAIEAGIETPLYTCTAWGGAAAPVREMLPMWGGYAFWPWIFYGDVKTHPATPEYIFRDFHNNAVPSTYNFDPGYDPEDCPYACCELGGGMTVCYKYRFTLPPESVSAMAIVKLAGGCNMLAYYMYHGGTNPRGKLTPFLNEHHVPKLSYDFQAPIGECGQVRRSYHELRLLHLFLRTWGRELCKTTTYLPDGAGAIEPLDLETVRWAVRAEGNRGFIFLCNYQDHAEPHTHRGVGLHLDLPGGETLRVPSTGGFTLEAGAACILPFHFDLDGLDLLYATAQPVTRIERDGEEIWFFAAPRGMAAEYAFRDENGLRIVVPGAGRVFEVPQGGRRRRIVTLTWEEALGFWLVDGKDGPRVLISEAAPLPSREGRRFELWGTGRLALKAWPPLPADAAPREIALKVLGEADGFFSSYDAELPPLSMTGALEVERFGPRTATVRLDRSRMAAVKDMILRVRYQGDIGEAYVDGQLVADDFANGTPWMIGASSLPEAAFEKGLDLRIVPIRKGSRVVNDTGMAGRFETFESEVGEILSVDLIPVRELALRL
jgi:hypothetical protein